METSQFEILRRGGQVFIERSDLVQYLLDESIYTRQNAGRSSLSPDYVEGMAFAMSALAQNIGSIGR